MDTGETSLIYKGTTVELIPTKNPIINLATVDTQKLAIKNNKQPPIPTISEIMKIVLLPILFKIIPATMQPKAAPKGTADVKIPINYRKN